VPDKILTNRFVHGVPGTDDENMRSPTGLEGIARFFAKKPNGIRRISNLPAIAPAAAGRGHENSLISKMTYTAQGWRPCWFKGVSA
jgi:hypothetical protein